MTRPGGVAGDSSRVPSAAAAAAAAVSASPFGLRASPAQGAPRVREEQAPRRGFVVLALTEVPVVDATGLSNLEVCMERLRDRGIHAIVAGVQTQPIRVLVRAGWRERNDRIPVRRDLAAALDDARRHLGKPSSGSGAATPASPA